MHVLWDNVKGRCGQSRKQVGADVDVLEIMVRRDAAKVDVKGREEVELFL